MKPSGIYKSVHIRKGYMGSISYHQDDFDIFGDPTQELSQLRSAKPGPRKLSCMHHAGLSCSCLRFQVSRYNEKSSRAAARLLVHESNVFHKLCIPTPRMGKSGRRGSMAFCVSARYAYPSIRDRKCFQRSAPPEELSALSCEDRRLESSCFRSWTVFWTPHSVVSDCQVTPRGEGEGLRTQYTLRMTTQTGEFRCSIINLRGSADTRIAAWLALCSVRLS